MLNASNLKKMFADEVLFDNVSFTVDENDKIGFIGENGAGKSTLFKIIAGEISWDFGDIFKNKNIKIGYLEQYTYNDSKKTVMEEFLSVFDEIIAIERELDEIHFDIEHRRGNLDELIFRQNALNERFLSLDGTYYKSRIRAALLGLGFSEDEFHMKVSNLSGGQKTRVALGKILLSNVNLLLLDEPTNHLDISSIYWLEEYLKSYKGAFIVISHDRYFLDKVTNKTFELENSRLYSFGGNYSFYMAKKEIDKKTREREYENTKREISRLEAIVEQQRMWNREKNIKTAESKMKVIERLEKKLEKPPEKTDNLYFKFSTDTIGGNDVLIAENLGKSFANKTLFKNADIHITRGERVFLIGPNGCGKTTLLKIISGLCTQDEGFFKIGANIKIGYYDQIQENLNMNKTIIDEVWDEYPKLTHTQIRNALAAFLFRGEAVFKEISKLSGGEKARVELVKLMLSRSNFLIMDEPTNHLDIASREALEKALSDYTGTMLVVSHDRYFINKLCTRVIQLSPNGIESFSGNYDDYSAKSFIEEKDTVSRAKDYQEQKRLLAQKRKIANQFSKTEEQISSIENKIARLSNELEKPEVAVDYIKAVEITEKISMLEKELEKLYLLWEELQEKMEQGV